MKVRLLITMIVMGTSLFAYAGAKDVFIEAVKTQCKKTQEEAKALATKGRTGNVMKLKTCTSDSIEISDDCVLNCKDASASIGG